MRSIGVPVRYIDDAAIDRHLFESCPRIQVFRRNASDPFPAANGDVDIERIKFDQSSNSSSSLCSIGATHKSNASRQSASGISKKNMIAQASVGGVSPT